MIVVRKPNLAPRDPRVSCFPYGTGGCWCWGTLRKHLHQKRMMNCSFHFPRWVKRGLLDLIDLTVMDPVTRGTFNNWMVVFLCFSKHFK
jgi:hypothetical protein